MSKELKNNNPLKKIEEEINNFLLLPNNKKNFEKELKNSYKTNNYTTKVNQNKESLSELFKKIKK